MRRAFTLIEILVVVALVAIAAGMVLGTRQPGRRGTQVRIAAEQLAHTLRQTRNRAIEERAVFAVAFHVENAPGSSGKVLNNRSGGHYYRVLGPRGQNMSGWGVSWVPLPRKGQPSLTTDTAIRGFLDDVSAAWVSDPLRLPKQEARFVALADQDNGDHYHWTDTWRNPYPIPWFGWYDKPTKRLYSWGFYDPSVIFGTQTGYNSGNPYPGRKVRTCADGKIQSPTGFYYEGYDGVISGCVQPTTRLVARDGDGGGLTQASIDAGKDPFDDELWRKDAPRPLVNADWLDAYIIFRPDGTARYMPWLDGRRDLSRYRGNIYVPRMFDDFTTAPFPITRLGFADRANYLSDWDIDRLSEERREATHFVSRTGWWYVTLGPDTDNDDGIFPNRTAAWRSLMPLWRVGISGFGAVKVVPVSGTMPSDVALDPTVGGTWYQSAAGKTHYEGHLLGDYKSLGKTPKPVEDFLTPEMLEDRTWWIKYW